MPVNTNIKKHHRIGLHHYPTVENPKYMSGTCDLYYGFQEYQDARSAWLLNKDDSKISKMDSHFHRVQYIIYKDAKNKGVEIIFLHEGLQLDWDTEVEAGLDKIYVSHLWPAPYNLDTAYRFVCGFLKPLGRIHWIAPDLFYWSKHLNDSIQEAA